MRDISKALRDYDAFTQGEDKLLLTDITQVMDIATDPDGKVNTYRAVLTALQAGYAIGYRTAKRQRTRSHEEDTATRGSH